MTDNPYFPPKYASLAGVAQQQSVRVGITVALVSFWIGVLLFALGSFITFVPGSEAGWFVVTACLLVPGFLIPKRRYRFASAALVGLCLLYAYFGYLDGVRYRERQNLGHPWKVISVSPQACFIKRPSWDQTPPALVCCFCSAYCYATKCRL